MKVNLAYGKTGLPVDVPKHSKIITPEYIPALPDEQGALTSAFRNPIDTRPLRQLASQGQKVGISVCDITRPIPSNRILPTILSELSHIPNEDITIFIATGTHRPNSHQELKEMLGHEIVDSGYKIINHNAFDDTELAFLGHTSNHIPIFLNRKWVECDVKITTGFVEPHFFAGFSGGPKMIAPGLAGFRTIMELHNYKMISNINSRWGITDGNPIHDSIREISANNPVDFSIEVTINREKGITSIHAGEMSATHRAACQFARITAMQKVPHKFDIVVTTNSGYPLDINLYQAIKGISAASLIVKEGGSIICAAECSDGIPDHGLYKDILKCSGSPSEILKTISAPDHNKQDQWQAQIQAQIQTKCQIYMKSDFLTNTQVKNAHLNPISDIKDTITGLDGQDSKVSICILPEGPQTIPYLDN